METKITAAIVDDEQGNRENLLHMRRYLLSANRKISAICSSVTEARTVLPEAKPDILFWISGWATIPVFPSWKVCRIFL